jgi:serine/threonine protein kinase
MSTKGIVHRDLKPENILLNSKRSGVYDIRLADFGFALELEPQSMIDCSDKGIVCGTPGYIAPEAIAGKGSNIKSDVFSVGSILFNMLTLKNLFPGVDYKAVMIKNKQCEWDNLEQRLRNCSPFAREVVIKLLQKDYSKRPTAREALAHQWFHKDRQPIDAIINMNKVLASKINPTFLEI